MTGKREREFWKNFMRNLYNNNFSHIYVEEQVLDEPVTKKVLAYFKDATVITIRHYKDVFNRPHQDYNSQKNSKALILAKNTGNLIFEGAPVCQDFGHDRFFYTASAMNCIYDCDYCFLKGMYPTANIVLFVNYEDYFKDVLKLLEEGPMYLCISYDTDLAALNGVTGLLDKWIEFAGEHPDLCIESRTKSAPMSFSNLPNVYYAFTLSPDAVINEFEKGTRLLRDRIEAVNSAISCGAKVRLCLDPMIYIQDYEKHYGELCDIMIKNIDFSKVSDISIGTFRISKEYLKQLRRVTPCSAATNYPFRNYDGYSMYPENLSQKMVGLMKERLVEVIDESRIFCE